ncbi:hypothetical protein HPP92_000840 [Vanilla planifolia]|uniref:Uncharacterized protein n=1 Tax=Vanilla planifolia TaxID=51239 RepID=A0A835VD10_VANPL|nr:hypothetical protein HPP92_000840 [Vanilla planifolia]
MSRLVTRRNLYGGFCYGNGRRGWHGKKHAEIGRVNGREGRRKGAPTLFRRHLGARAVQLGSRGRRQDVR